MIAQREIQGFVTYLASAFALAVYLVLAIVPDSLLHAIGITYYPSKTWAVSIPLWIISLIPFTLIFYTATNLCNTPPLSHPSTVTDEHASVCNANMGSYFHHSRLMDVPITTINRFMLYEKYSKQNPQQRSSVSSARRSASPTRI
ncbi:PIG-P-domain-containing protein [Chytriomyces sp. MP71]|nr:PIG-P-domain-containing protein [Chytriomyces sp. MP71]